MEFEVVPGFTKRLCLMSISKNFSMSKLCLLIAYTASNTMPPFEFSIGNIPRSISPLSKLVSVFSTLIR